MYAMCLLRCDLADTLFFRFVTTWETILLVMSTRDTNGKLKHSLLLIIVMNAGMQVSSILYQHNFRITNF